jgi:hypothetical protein
MVSHAAIVVKPIHKSVQNRVIIKAMLLVAISAHSFGKAAAFQPLRRIFRTRTITTTKFSLSTQLPMSSSIEQERKVPVNSLRSFRSSSSQHQQNDDDVLVLDPLIVCGPSGVGTYGIHSCPLLGVSLALVCSVTNALNHALTRVLMIVFHRQGNDY